MFANFNVYLHVYIYIYIKHLHITSGFKNSVRARVDLLEA